MSVTDTPPVSEAAQDEAAGEAAAAHVALRAGAARVAARRLALLSRASKDATLRAMAQALRTHCDAIVAANQGDLDRGRARGLGEGLLDRLVMDHDRVYAVAAGLEAIADLPDPVGEVVRGSTLANGLQLRQVRVPMGVVAIIYEARPNVTVDAAGLALKSGNAVILRGGSAAAGTNAELVCVLRDALTEQGQPADAVALLDEGGREGARALMRARGLIDLLIPRGGADLIETVVRESTVPVIETGVGNCHVYVDAGADLAGAAQIVVNSKVDRPSVCNAAESLLVHRDIAAAFVPAVLAELAAEGVRIHGDRRTVELARGSGVPVEAATPQDYATEYLALEISVAVVDSLDEAIEHIERFGTGHTEAILTQDRRAAREFVARVDAAAVMVNASTRFTDGGQFGFGAEIGISTQKLHARGPMALPELTSTKWVVEGDGQIVG